MFGGAKANCTWKEAQITEKLPPLVRQSDEIIKVKDENPDIGGCAL